MKKKDINEQIARLVGKSPMTIKNWQARHPELYEIAVLGTYCKENDLTKEKIEKLIELQEIIRGKA